MTDETKRMCVLLPCGNGQRWAVPQACLAEILTLQEAEDSPPAQVSWRGSDLPVLDLGDGGSEPWLNPRTSSGLIAVILGVTGAGADHWALAVRGDGLAVRNVNEQDCQDRPEDEQDYALAAFELAGTLYQVPDLPSLQQRALQLETAVSA